MTKTKTKNCEFCGKPIPKARLEALPNTAHCVKCVDEHGPKREIDVDSIVAKPSLSCQNGFGASD